MRLTCSSSSVRFSPSSLATRFRFLKEIFPCRHKQPKEEQNKSMLSFPSLLNFNIQHRDRHTIKKEERDWMSKDRTTSIEEKTTKTYGLILVKESERFQNLFFGVLFSLRRKIGEAPSVVTFGWCVATNNARIHKSFSTLMNQGLSLFLSLSLLLSLSCSHQHHGRHCDKANLPFYSSSAARTHWNR